MTDSISIPPKRVQAQKPTSEPPRILLIDDSPEELSLLISMMSHRKIRFNVAFDGKDGISKAGLVCPDLIILDIRMPRMDGLSTCRLLKNNPATAAIPVIFLSALNDVESRIQGLAMGAVDFIGKPFVAEEVLIRVDIHLNLYRRQNEHIAAQQTGAEAFFTHLPRTDAILLKAACDFLMNHLDQSLSMEQLSQALSCHPKRINQVFRDGIGLPPFTWLREERLQQARNLLMSTDMPVAAVADYLGYSSQANFAKAFRERFGCSARELRQQLNP